MRDTPEEKPGKNGNVEVQWNSIKKCGKCEILQKRNLVGNVEVQWNSIKKCVLDTVSDLLVKSKGEHESMDYAGKD